MDSKTDFKVYWESQGKNQMCGLHCINSLLQGPFFDADMLKDIATHLDEEEAKLLGIEHKSKNYRSVNYDGDGNYNIQVITEALKIYNVEIQPKKKQDLDKILESSLSDVEGFILNSSTHWIALRKIHGIWFNLNSTNPLPGPQIVSEFYFSAFMDETYKYGFTHFQVIGLSPVDEKSFDLMSYPKNCRVVDFSEIQKVKPSKINYGDTDDMEMERAILESKMLNPEQIKNEAKYHFENENEYEDEIDPDMKKILELSLAEYNKAAGIQDLKEQEVKNVEELITVIIQDKDEVWDPIQFNKYSKAEEIQAYCQKKLNVTSQVNIHIDSTTTETLDSSKIIMELADKQEAIFLYID